MRIKQIHEDATAQTLQSLEAYLKRIEALTDPADVYEDLLTMVGIQKQHGIPSGGLLQRQIKLARKLPEAGSRTIMAKLSDLNKAEDVAQHEYEQAEQKVAGEKTVLQAVLDYLKEMRVDYVIGQGSRILIPDAQEPFIQISFGKTSVVIKVGSDEAKVFACGDMEDATTASHLLKHLDNVCKSL